MRLVELQQVQVVVICGRNEALRKKLGSGIYSTGVTQVHAFGFMKNMHEFMNASDAIITKAGAGPRLFFSSLLFCSLLFFFCLMALLAALLHLPPHTPPLAAWILHGPAHPPCMCEYSCTEYVAAFCWPRNAGGKSWIAAVDVCWWVQLQC
jgi:hypothetical protein